MDNSGACDAGRMLVFVPLAPAELATWATSGTRDVTGFAATPGFLHAFGLGSPTSEDADLTLLEVAGIEGLLAHRVRLVAVCDAEVDGVEPAEFGAVEASGVAWTAVQSLFGDDEPGAARAAQTREALGAVTLDEAWDAPAVAELLRATELLWHGAGEWERLSD